MNYSQKLRDPRWQRRRLEIMQVANFKCADCNNREKTLNVHHLKYRHGAAPWEYLDAELVCLCEDCHLMRHLKEKAFNEDTNIALEGAIAEAWGILTTTVDRDTRASAARVMSALVALRTPTQVARMELSQGLRKSA